MLTSCGVVSVGSCFCSNYFPSWNIPNSLFSRKHTPRVPIINHGGKKNPNIPLEFSINYHFHEWVASYHYDRNDDNNN